MKKRFNNNGMGLLSLLFAVAIIGLIYYFAAQADKKSPAAKDGYFKQTTLDASSYKRTMDNTKKIIDNVSKTKSIQSEGF